MSPARAPGLTYCVGIMVPCSDDYVRLDDADLGSGHVHADTGALVETQGVGKDGLAANINEPRQTKSLGIRLHIAVAA